MHSSPVVKEWDTEAVLTVPNVLSFIRLLGIPVFCWLILAGHDLAAVIMLAVFGVTDWFDGYLARRLKQRSRLGTRLDPIADRLYILAAVAALKDGPFCVGFAAESRNLEEYAQAKRQRKGIPLIAGNLIQDGFGGDDNRLVLFDDNGIHLQSVMSTTQAKLTCQASVSMQVSNKSIISLPVS